MIELVPVSLWRNSYLVNRDKNRQVCAELNQKFYLFKCTTWQKKYLMIQIINKKTYDTYPSF